MARESGNTVYIISLIFAIALALGMLGVAYKMNTDLVKQVTKTKREKQEVEKLQAKVKEYLVELEEARRLVNDENTPIKYDQYQDTILKDARTTLENVLNEEWVTREDIETIKDPRIKETWEKLLAYKTNMPEFKNLSSLYRVLLLQLKAVIHLVPRLRVLRVVANEQVKVERREKARIGKEKQEVIDKLRTKLTQEQDKALESARRFDQEKRKLTDEIDKLNKSKGRSEKIHKLQLAKLQSEKSGLLQRIKDLRKKEKRNLESTGADGEVLHANPELGYAWIDLGKNHNLREGVVFEVFRFVKGGRKKIKGKILVKVIENDMAKCAVLTGVKHTDPITGRALLLPTLNDPIVKGDLIRTPLFDRDEQQVFVFLGNKVTNRSYNLKELQRKIEEVGGKVNKSVTIESDFVIVLGNAEEEFAEEMEKAAQYNVIFMREDELIRFLQR